MKIEEYQDVVITISRFRGLTRDCARMLVDKYKRFDRFTLYSILSQEVQQRMKVSHRKVYGKKTSYYESYQEAIRRGEPDGVLLRQAIALDTCPALYARRVLEQCYNIDDDKMSKSKLSKMMRDTTLIPNAQLSYEIFMCVMYDDQYGPLANAISESVGEQYEVLLENFLKERNISYYNEDYLRIKGYDKTPDCKLEVPIAVNGFVINWIESKAQFGSPETHKKYINEQFLSYWNRFGPGLVIYWFGFVDNVVQSTETRFIVMDHFPKNITYMDPSSLSQSTL